MYEVAAAFAVDVVAARVATGIVAVVVGIVVVPEKSHQV